MLTLNVKEENPHTFLEIRGEIDASNSVMLDEAITSLVQKGATSILIDCTGLDYISSAGLGVFMSYLEDFAENNISMKIFGLSPKVLEVFRILGLDQLITISADKASAIAS